MNSSGGVPRETLADSLTRDYPLKGGFSDGVRNTPAELSPPAHGVVVAVGVLPANGAGLPARWECAE